MKLAMFVAQTKLRNNTHQSNLIKTLDTDNRVIE